MAASSEPQHEWSEFTGQSFEEIQDAGWLEAIHPDDREQTSEVWASAVETKSIYKVEHRIRRKDGEWRHMLVRAVPITDEADERIVEWIGTSTDITDRKEMEIELELARDAAEQANIAKSQFIANMSHELRTPLSAVIGYSEMLQEELEDRGDDELLEDMRKIESNARHLLGLINDVLDLSKIEAEKMDVYLEDFSVAEMVGDVASTVDTLFTKKDNAFELALVGGDAALGAMRSDITKIRQCLINLLSNASKFTERGTIRLEVTRAVRDGEDWLTFSVADTGIGMSQEQLANLFERFAQADASTTRKFGGSGLGLAITRSFCSMLGGSIVVTSAEGQGTTFTIELPAQAPQARETSSPDQLDDGAPPNHGVLIVDDDAATRELLARFMQKEGLAVRTAEDGQAGLALARQMRPRVILLDVTMPRMDGWSVLRELKSDPALSSIPVVMVSIIDEQNLAFTLGASDYLLKPIEMGSPERRHGPAEKDKRGRHGPDRRRRRTCAATAVGHARKGRMDIDAGGERRRGAGGSQEAEAGPDPARPDDAGNGRLHLPAAAARESGLGRRPGDRPHRQGHRCERPEAPAAGGRHDHPEGQSRSARLVEGSAEISPDLSARRGRPTAMLMRINVRRSRRAYLGASDQRTPAHAHAHF